MKIDELLIKTKIVFDRGRYWLGYMTFLMMVFVTVTSMKEYSYFEFLRSWYWLAFILAGSVAGMFVLGYIELKHVKAYQKEAEIYAQINPVQKKIFENQERILKKLEELEEAQERNNKK